MEDGFLQFYLVLLGEEWLEDVVPHAEEHGRVDDMERPVTKQYSKARIPTFLKTNLPEPKWKPLLNEVDHDELIFQRHRAELLEPEALPVEHGSDAGHLVQGLIS